MMTTMREASYVVAQLNYAADVPFVLTNIEGTEEVPGHKTNSDIYSHYHSAVSKVKMQERFRGVRAGNAAEMYGLSLNRIPQLPETISGAWWLRVY